MNRQPFYGIKLRVFLRKVLVQGIYKLLAADAVYNTSLFQRFHLGRRAANTVHSSSHQDIGGIDICTEQFSHKCFLCYLHEQFLLLILLYCYTKSIILFVSLGKADFI